VANQETVIQQNILLSLSKGNKRLFRNNCGGYKTDSGGFVKYGVANPGGSDIIGWTSRIITPDMVGEKIAVFTAIEVKAGRNKPTPQQQAFIDRVNADGGIAGIARSADEAEALCQ
jgi:hypothetical protein